jgi:hypothetical protein
MSQPIKVVISQAVYECLVGASFGEGRTIPQHAAVLVERALVAAGHALNRPECPACNPVYVSAGRRAALDRSERLRRLRCRVKYPTRPYRRLETMQPGVFGVRTEIESWGGPVREVTMVSEADAWPGIRGLLDSLAGLPD